VSPAEFITVPEVGLVDPSDDEHALEGLRDRIDTVLLSESVLKDRVRELARRVCDDHRASARLTLLIVLDGAVVFAADLAREISRCGGLDVILDFIKTRTYGDEIKSGGETERDVRVLLEPSAVRDRDVLIVEDIVDQGFTLARIRRLIEEAGARSVRICTLLTKRLANPTDEVRRIRDSLTLDYVGFDIPDRWIAGYGIDASGDFRELPFIVAVRESHYLGRKD
jgi:hypoxanthine phosphoribosyltransferase